MYRMNIRNTDCTVEDKSEVLRAVWNGCSIVRVDVSSGLVTNNKYRFVRLFVVVGIFNYLGVSKHSNK